MKYEYEIFDICENNTNRFCDIRDIFEGKNENPAGDEGEKIFDEVIRLYPELLMSNFQGYWKDYVMKYKRDYPQFFV
jgi:hypothetical protein